MVNGEEVQPPAAVPISLFCPAGLETMRKRRTNAPRPLIIVGPL